MDLPAPSSSGGAPSTSKTTSPSANNVLGAPWQPLEKSSPYGQEASSKPYPFYNFWSVGGNLDEVLFALPSKESAELLVTSFFKYVDPLYPIISENLFRSQFEEFWALAPNARGGYNTMWVALQYIVFALGHLFVHNPSAIDFTSIPETYLSCCYRALCLVSFLSEWSLDTIRILILICNYFVTNTRTADCWTFSGILQKVVYGLDLHQPPRANASISEKYLRFALWQAFMFQDVSLSYYLELVPASCHHSIDVSMLRPMDDGENNPDSRLQEILSTQSSGVDLGFLSNKTDVAYRRAMWQFSKFMQTHICLPIALGKPVVHDSAHKIGLLSDLQSIYENLDLPFNTGDLRGPPTRVWRQRIMVHSNYNFAFTMLYLARNPTSDVNVDWRGALQSSHRAMSAFFNLINVDRQYLAMWTPANTRAYAQTLMICKVLSAAKEQLQGQEDAWVQLAVGNVERYVDLLKNTSGAPAFETQKQEYLKELSGYQAILSNGA